MEALALAIWQWLETPIDPTRPHNMDAMAAWHARSMYLAWGIFIPLGVIIARYLKITPNQNFPEELDNQFWWYSHLFFQQVGAVLMLIGMGLMLSKTGLRVPKSLHGYLGWLVILGCLVQILSGYLRGTKGGPTEPAPDGSYFGDHYSMTRRRLIFEQLHKVLGYGLLLISAVTIIFGFWSANAPIWMWCSLAAVWLVMIALVWRFQRKGMAMSSYKAIWGEEWNAKG